MCILCNILSITVKRSLESKVASTNTHLSHIYLCLIPLHLFLSVFVSLLLSVPLSFFFSLSLYLSPNDVEKIATTSSSAFFVLIVIVGDDGKNDDRLTEEGVNKEEEEVFMREGVAKGYCWSCCCDMNWGWEERGTGV